nr:hypothetical protein [Tanacetum cinerariifolium]
MMKKQKTRKLRRQDTKETQPSGPTTNVKDKALNKEKVLNLETTKTAQAKEILNLKKRVKILEKKRWLRTHGLKRLYKVGLRARVESSANKAYLDKEDASKQGRISDIDANQDIYFVNVHRDKDIFGVNDQDDTLMFDADKDLQGKEVVVEEVNAASIATSITAAATTAASFNDLTLAHALMETKTLKPKAMGLLCQSQAKVDADYQLAERLQAKEQEQLTDAEKVEDDKEQEELKRCLEIVLDDVTINATPLSSKYLTIVDYKIYKEGKQSYFQIIRADGNSQMYLTFSKMLKNFNREDLEVHWSIVKTRFEKTMPVNYMDTSLFQYLKTMFEHHVEDNI